MARKLEIKAIFRAIDKVSRPMSRMQKRVHRFTSRMERGLRKVNRVSDKLVRGFKTVARVAAKALVAGVVGAGLAVGYLVKQFSKIEDAEAAFTPLLGGAKKAKEMVDQLNKTAATTPFQFENLADTAKQLLPVMDGDIERTIKTVRMLGDTAGGNAKKLESITRGFTKASLKGKVDMESLNMIAEAGVPIFTELATSMGMAVGPEFFKQMRAGKISVDDLNTAFETMTKDGGLFFKGMEIASKTTSGIFSTLKDNVQLTAAGLGETLAPVIKDIMKSAIEMTQRIREWVENNKELIKSKVVDFVERARKGLEKMVEKIREMNKQRNLIDMFFKAIKKVGEVISFLKEHGKTIATIVAVIGTLIVIAKVLIGVLTLVNLVMMANPVTLIVLGIMALIAILVALAVHFDVFRLLGDFFQELWLDIKMNTDRFFKAMVKAFGMAVKSIKDTFTSIKDMVIHIWDSIVAGIKSRIEKIKNFIGPIVDAVKSVFGADEAKPGLTIVDGGRDDRAGMGPGGSFTPQVVSPEEKTARYIEESRKTSSAEVTIKDATGRAEVTRGELGQGVTLDRTGSF